MTPKEEKIKKAFEQLNTVLSELNTEDKIEAQLMTKGSSYAVATFTKDTDFRNIILIERKETKIL